MESSPHPAYSGPGGPRGKRVLAIDPGLGSIYFCKSCGNIHLNIGCSHVQMDFAVLQSLLILLERAAANYELWEDPEWGFA